MMGKLGGRNRWRAISQWNAYESHPRASTSKVLQLHSCRGYNPDYAYPSELISIGCSELSSFSQFLSNENSAQSFPYPKVTFSVSF
jgi:hypothetical protein